MKSSLVVKTIVILKLTGCGSVKLFVTLLVPSFPCLLSKQWGFAKWLWVTERLKSERKQDSSPCGCTGDPDMKYSPEELLGRKTICHLLLFWTNSASCFWSQGCSKLTLIFNLHFLTFFQHSLKINVQTDSASTIGRPACALNQL